MEYMQLKEIVDIYLGLTHTPKYVEEGIPFLSVKDISDGKIDFSNCHYITEEEYASLPKGARPQKGDMLFCRIGTIGKPIIIDENTRDFGSFVSLGFFRKKNNDYSLEYLKYWMNSQLFEKQVKQNVKGVAQINLNTGWLKEFIVPKKSINEQIIIINKLNIIQEIIDIRKKQIEELDDLVKSKFVEMFGTVKDNKYNTKTLVEVTKKERNSIKRGPFGGSLKKDDFVECGYLVYEQRHAIHNDFEYEKYYITEEKYKEMEMFKVEPKDLIISCSGVTLGRIAEVPQNAKKGIINQALLKITLDSNVMNNVYFIYHFKSNEVQEKLFSFSRGSGIPNFPSMNEVKKIKYVCPPIELQNKFAYFVKQIDKQKLEIQKSLEETQKLQESLMNKYFG